MTPIVSPWLIYLINTLDGVHNIISAFGFLLVVAEIIIGTSLDEFVKEELRLKRIKQMKLCFVGIVFLGVLYVIIPTKNTVIQMIVANMVTPDNINLVQDNIIDFIKQVSEAINHGN